MSNSNPSSQFFLKETLISSQGSEVKSYDREGFATKSSLMKAIRTRVPLTGEQIYELSKKGKTQVFSHGFERRLEILKKDV